MISNIRAEVEITINKTSYLLRPTFAALCSIEQQINKSVITLMLNIQTKGILITEVIAIIKAGIRAAGGIIPEDIEQLIYLEGLTKFIPIICKFLEIGLNV